MSQFRQVLLKLLLEEILNDTSAAGDLGTRHLCNFISGSTEDGEIFAKIFSQIFLNWAILVWGTSWYTTTGRIKAILQSIQMGNWALYDCFFQQKVWGENLNHLLFGELLFYSLNMRIRLFNFFLVLPKASLIYRLISTILLSAFVLQGQSCFFQ